METEKILKDIDKPIVIFTNFWDANKLIDIGFIITNKNDKFYKINLFKDKSNYSIHSIALTHPSLNKLSHLKNTMNRIDFFCPTYNLLQRYKDKGDWEAYVKDYKKILKDRKDKIKKWVDSLQVNRIYILCCWENTSLESKCHRQLIYAAFNASKYTKNKIMTIYRNGNEIKTRKQIKQIPDYDFLDNNDDNNDEINAEDID